MSDFLTSYRENLTTSLTIRRVNRSPTPSVEATVLGHVRGYLPEELSGGVNVGDRKVLILAESLQSVIDEGWPGPLKRGDKIINNGVTLTIDLIDDWSRRDGNILLAYEIRATGA